VARRDPDQAEPQDRLTPRARLLLHSRLPPRCRNDGSSARALAVEPDLIICDEVTSALDQIVAEGILKLLLRLQKELGVSYLYITHDLATVKAIADWVVVMHQGKVVQQGPKEQVLKPPHHPYTELLLSSVPEMDPRRLDGLLARRAAAASAKMAPVA